MVVRDHDLGTIDLLEHVARNEFAAHVVAVGIIWLQNAQPVLDRQSRGANQKTSRELRTCRMPHGVDGLPRDDHGHNGRLTCTRGSFSTRRISSGFASLFAAARWPSTRC